MRGLLSIQTSFHPPVDLVLVLVLMLMSKRLKGAIGEVLHDFTNSCSLDCDHKDANLGEISGRQTAHIFFQATAMSNINANASRRRYGFACIACRRKKTRCSGKTPRCQQCLKSGESCIYKESASYDLQLPQELHTTQKSTTCAGRLSPTSVTDHSGRARWPQASRTQRISVTVDSEARRPQSHRQAPAPGPVLQQMSTFMSVAKMTR